MNGGRIVQLAQGVDDTRSRREGLGRDELLRLLDVAEQRIESLRRNERLQLALYEIADLAGSSLDMQDMLRRIHAIVGELMYAENFYIVLYDERRKKMRFLYFVDKLDPYVNDPDAELDFDQAEATLTITLLRSGAAMRGPSRELRERNGIAHDEMNGPDSADWMGVPMLRDDVVAGGIVVQSYERPGMYSEEERVLLAYVAQHILTALDRHHAREQLEHRVEERTRELKQANLDLQAEVLERQRSQEL